MRVALYQCPPLPLDVSGNLKRLHQVAQGAAGADVLVLPEMFLSGYNIGVEAAGGPAPGAGGGVSAGAAAAAGRAGGGVWGGFPGGGGE
ncbi:nitrilase-related carbon-nitrogen hydrolase, partial [Pseudomonas poae]|uniref:nitrilase-related carbon-nitrogen hydrolase n=1 Tax=Pseudomonas poae TaxID=200451 RepID=UPI002E329AEA